MFEIAIDLLAMYAIFVASMVTLGLLMSLSFLIRGDMIVTAKKHE